MSQFMQQNYLFGGCKSTWITGSNIQCLHFPVDDA